jgi:hypothetical protein
MRSFAAVVLVALALWAAPAGAQVFGQFTPAHPIPGGGNLFGGYLQLGDRADVGILGQVRFSSGSSVNWGLQVGFADSDPGDGAVELGGDTRTRVHQATDDFPLDVAFDAGIGLTIADEVTFLEVGPQIQYSHRFPLEGSDGAISPYGSLFLDINHVSFDDSNLPPGFDNSDTDLDLVARFGLEWELTRKFQIMGELEVGRGTNFSTGINAPF